MFESNNINFPVPTCVPDSPSCFSRLIGTGRPVYMAALVLVVAACTGQSVRDDGPSAEAAGAAQETAAEPSEANIVRVEPARPKIALTRELLYKILEAEFAGQRGYIDVSLQNYLELARDTRDPKIVERATRIAVFARDAAAAEETAELWVELDPRNPDPHQVLAVIAIRSGDVELSLQHLESIIDYTYGELDQKLLMIVNLLGREADRNIIMEVMERLMANRQDSSEALFAFSRVAAMMGDYERALQLLERTYVLRPDDDSVALGYVAILQRLDRTEEALLWLERAMEKRSDNDFNLRLTYARLLSDVSRFNESRRQFEILNIKAPNNADVMFALGLLYLQAGQVGNAQEHFLRLSKRGVRTNEVNYYLGLIEEDRQDFGKAGIWYQGVHSGPNYFESQIRLAKMLARQDRLDDARAHLNAIRTDNEGEAALLVQAEAELMVEREQLNEAMKVYDKALDRGYNSDILYSRAMLAEKIDRLDILEADLRRIIEQEPDNAQALNALGYTLADRTERYDEANLLIDQALQLRPNDHYILDSKGWVLYRLGKHDEAIKYLRKAMDLLPDGEIAAHLGEVLWVTGAKKEAMQVWESALEATPDNVLLQDVIQRFNP